MLVSEVGHIRVKTKMANIHILLHVLIQVSHLMTKLHFFVTFHGI